MIEMRTSWGKQTPPNGNLNDYFIIESIGADDRIIINQRNLII
jgi:hypothetical protein